MKVLVCGGAGYVGTHTCVELLENGYQVIVLDNLSNSRYSSLERVQEITGKKLTFIQADMLDRLALEDVFQAHQISAVIHFAGLKAVAESVKLPIKYYQNNISGTLTLLDVMSQAGCKDIVFSSSATVYGAPQVLPIKENAPLFSINPYGTSKLIIENILQDIIAADRGWNISILRYFNPVGAHESALIGEEPNGIPNNLVPYICQVAAGKIDKLSIFGGDYPTKDGTGVRDYIHVVDLAKGHIKALTRLEQEPGCIIHNLGTGIGYSVLEIVAAMKKASGIDIPYQIVDRRRGDIAACFSDPTLAREELNWVAEKNVEQMCEDSWKWQISNNKTKHL
ncbi:MAG: UDP-glucose 4-epimerase GalE [Candidatus Sedimenticola sp. (ex Thyasira tokunagai)]